MIVPTVTIYIFINTEYKMFFKKNLLSKSILQAFASKLGLNCNEKARIQLLKGVSGIVRPGRKVHCLSATRIVDPVCHVNSSIS